MRFGGIFLATAALLLSACSGEPEPKEPTTTPKPVPTSTATLPAMPDQAKEDSPEGAAAFVTHWVNVLNYAAATGDVEELERLSAEDCEGCQRYIEQITSTYDAGGYYEGGEWSWGKLKLQGFDDHVVVTTTLTSADGERSSGVGEPVSEAGTSDRFQFYLPAEAPWSIKGFFLEDAR